MNYVMQLLPLIIALAIFGFACRKGYNKKTLIVALVLSLLGSIPAFTSIYAATTSIVIGFALWYSLIEGIKWVVVKVRA